jgi:carboxylesterase type B
MFQRSACQRSHVIIFSACMCIVAGCSGSGHHAASETATATASRTATATVTVTSPASTATSTATETPTSTTRPSATATATSTLAATPTGPPTPTGTPEPDCPVGPITTSVGVVCGTTATVGTTSVRAFLGIPYAEDTSGDNRWRAPIPKTAMSGKFQATQFGPICPQGQPLGDSSPGASLDATMTQSAWAAGPDRDMRKGFGSRLVPRAEAIESPQQSEDCLSINVWTPIGARAGTDLPVMVFVYGGSFLTGGSAYPVYDGAYLSATQNAVVVTFNYRLGALGFLGGIEDLTGNYGILDQQLALHWVADNIAAFGGKPSQVMLFGESAGAMSVGLHLLSIPSSEGLFASALMESNPLALPYKTLDEAGTISSCLQMALGCASGDLACLRGKSAEEILETQESQQVFVEGLGQGFAGLLLWAPVVDGTLIERQPVAGITGGLPKPTLLGTNANEGTVFVDVALAKLMQKTLAPQLYNLLLTKVFGSTDTARIEQVYPPVMDDSGPQLAQLITDYMFFCSSRHVAAAGGQPAYGYLFNKVSSFNYWPHVEQCKDEVCHADELPYVFHTASNIGFTFLPSEEALSQSMAAYWGAYSREGSDPNNGGLPRPEWPAFAGSHYLVLDSPISTVVDPPHHCDLWDDIGYETVSFSSLLSQTTCMPPTPTPTSTSG